jgi:hypothetical protein
MVHGLFELINLIFIDWRKCTKEVKEFQECIKSSKKDTK